MKIIYYQIKAVRIILIAAFVISVLLALLITRIGCNNPDISVIYKFINIITISLMPLIFSLPSICIAYNLVDIDGAELQYIGSKIKIMYYISVFLGSIVLLAFPYAIISFLNTSLALWLYLKAVVVLLLYTAIIYASIYLFRNIEIPIVICLVMSIFAGIVINNNLNFLHITSDIHIGKDFYLNNIYTFLASVVIFIAGIAANYKCEIS